MQVGAKHNKLTMHLSHSPCSWNANKPTTNQGSAHPSASCRPAAKLPSWSMADSGSLTQEKQHWVDLMLSLLTSKAQMLRTSWSHSLMSQTLVRTQGIIINWHVQMTNNLIQPPRKPVYRTFVHRSHEMQAALYLWRFASPLVRARTFNLIFAKGPFFP